MKGGAVTIISNQWIIVAFGSAGVEGMLLNGCWISPVSYGYYLEWEEAFVRNKLSQVM
jgi:hypothetical protein